MNERIKQLALEAFQPINDIASEGVADRSTFDQKWFQLYNQKFAELIVRACIANVKMRKEFAMEDEHVVEHAFDLLVYDLESYFGVEE